MRIGIGLPPKGTPGTGPSAVVKILMSDPWLTNRTDGRQGERIATGWSWDASGTILRLKLRKDVYFHDGTLLTPEIAAEALQRSAALRKASPAASAEAFSFSSITAIAASGPDEVEIRLKERNTFILPDLTGVFVLKPDKPDIGTGPFQIVSKDPERGVLLSAFPRYYRGQPALSEIELLSYPTQRSAWAAMMRGDIDMLHEVKRDAAEFVEAETTLKTYSFVRPYYIPLVFNMRHPVLKQRDVRIAINEAFDRSALVNDGMSGRGRPADGPVWPQHWAYSPPTHPFVYNPASAQQRLDAAGIKAAVTPANGLSTRFTFTCLVFAGDSRFERMAVLVQKQLADVGIEMKLLPLPQKELVSRLQSGDFDAFLFEMAGRSLSWVYEMWRSHDGTMNNTGYRAADAAFDRIRGARSDDEVRAAVAELTQILHDDPPAAFLAWQTTSRAVSTKFDVAAEEDRDIFANPWQWRPRAGPQQASR